MEEKENEIKKKTEELSEIIKESEEELKELRKDCRHLEYKIKDVNTDSSILELRRVCSVCGHMLGFPSKEDLEDNGYKS